MISWKALILSQVGLIVFVEILGMSSSLTGRNSKISYGFMIIVILTMSLGHRRVSSVGNTDKYNQFLKPKWNIP